MNQLVLRNDRVDSGAWFGTAAAFSALGFLVFCGLGVMNIRDPKALWMGPSVKAPQVIYIVFDVVTLLIAMAALAVFKSKKFFDRLEQLIIDGSGVHDLRANGQKIAWSQLAKVKGWAMYSGGIATLAQLQLEKKNGSPSRSIFSASTRIISRLSRWPRG